MRYISVCSGIEAASVAWQPLGWEAVAFAEIEPFPCAVLAHHYPDVPNVGDITKVDWRKYANSVDLVVGGTPCQSFSVAGKREGLDGASGLVREYFRLLSEVHPRFFLWENVPGCLSSGTPKGSDFEFILRQWSDLGYHVAWRILDAQYFGVAQRRRRLFAFGSLRNWRDPVKVLFEPEGLPGDTPPRRKARQADFGGVATGTGKTSGFRMTAFGEYADDDTGSALKARDYKDATDLVVSQYGDVAGTLSARHSSPCVDRGQNIIAFKVRQGKDGRGKGYLGCEEAAFTLSCNQDQQLFVPMSFCERGREGGRNLECQNDIAYCLTNPGDGGRSPSRNIMDSVSMVRRLTPTECERLQGFPDCWTDIPFKGKPAPDGARYKALGNSMAVPCMRWIGERIQMVEDGKL